MVITVIWELILLVSWRGCADVDPNFKWILSSFRPLGGIQTAIFEAKISWQISWDRLGGSASPYSMRTGIVLAFHLDFFG